MNTWLISDTHFGHRNILSFRQDDGTPLRMFSSVSEMDEQMISNWNSVVGLEDKVYHIGDVAMLNFTKTQEILSRLNGTKVLIKGNHDNLKMSQYQYLFKDVRAYHVLDGILLAHIPVHPLSLQRWRGQIHGHLHNRVVLMGPHRPDPLYFNVSVERINYTPINFEEVRKYFETLRGRTEYMGSSNKRT